MSQLMIGLPGPRLDRAARDWLQQRQVAGVILFARNVESRPQVEALNRELRQLRPDLLLAVDQEGGRVRRLREGFLELPALAEIGALWAVDPSYARRAARLHAELMVSDVRSAGFDFSFAPVADVAGGNACIGDRALHADPEIAARLVALYVQKQQECGMAATLKHFPGHGAVSADSHLDLACDERPVEAICADLLPFAAGVEAGARGVMMAHIAVPAVDSAIAGASQRWIDVLRHGLGFAGAILSDDLAMLGAAALGDLDARLEGHRAAGCDLLLVCEPDQVDTALAHSAGWRVSRAANSRVHALRGSSKAIAPSPHELARCWRLLQELLEYG